VEKLRDVAARHRVPLSSYTTVALEEALRADELGASLREVVDLYQIMKIQMGVDAVHIPRSSLEHMIKELYPTNGEELRRIWYESGRWYGAYLRTKLKDGDVIGFLEKALLVSWDLDEVEIKNDDGDIILRCTSFTMSLESTELIISYISGAMSALGYKELTKKHLRGMATVHYRVNLSR